MRYVDCIIEVINYVIESIMLQHEATQVNHATEWKWQQVNTEHSSKETTLSVSILESFYCKILPVSAHNYFVNKKVLFCQISIWVLTDLIMAYLTWLHLLLT